MSGDVKSAFKQHRPRLPAQRGVIIYCNHCEQKCLRVVILIGGIWRHSYEGCDILSMMLSSLCSILLSTTTSMFFLDAFIHQSSFTFPLPALFCLQFRVFTAPFHRVEFADFWLADQLNSLVFVLMDLEYLICFYIFELQWGNSKGLLPKFKGDACLQWLF